MSSPYPAADDEAIFICDYDPSWQHKYETERDRLLHSLNGEVRDIQHIGSTALPGVAAKDCIDMMVVVDELEPLQHYLPTLQKMGYVFENVSDSGRYFFHRQAPRSHHLHIVQKDTWHYWRWILFRDYLLAHPEIALGYVSLKRHIAMAVAGNREAYTLAKTEFVKHIERQAFADRPELEARFASELS